MKIFVQVTGEARSGKTELVSKLRKVVHEFAILRKMSKISITVNETTVQNYELVLASTVSSDNPVVNDPQESR